MASHRFPELEDQRTESWHYRAEGEHNLVLSYAGHHPSLRGTALRVAKIRPGKAPEPTAAAQYDFVSRVAAAAAGTQRVEVGELRSASENLLESFEPTAALHRAKRHRGSRVDHSATTVLLMRDLALFPGAAHSVMFEIKASTHAHALQPKWGHLQPGMRACRFCMQQVFRDKDKEPESVEQSDFCPLGLFSSDRVRSARALRLLVECPRTYLSIFVDGVRVLPPPERCASPEPAPPSWSLRALLAPGGAALVQSACGSSDSSDPLASVVEDVSHAMAEAGVMQAIRRVQLNDGWGAEAASAAWRALVEQWPQVAGDGDAWGGIDDREVAHVVGSQPQACPRPDWPDAFRTQAGVRIETEEEARYVLARVRAFLLSMTFKDCSVFVAVPGARGAGAAHREASVVIADVDMRQTDQLQRFLEQDRSIISHFLSTGSTRQCHE
eukprot:m51a1_g7539 hypothetical protein (441) ;mRNA; r:62913-64440